MDTDSPNITRLATLCYVRNGGKTLMIHRVKKQNDMHLGKWNGLGGKLESGETPEACALREIREESGLVAKDLMFKGLITFPGFANEENWYTFIYVVNSFDGELIDPEEGYLAWIDDDKLLDLPLWDGDKIFLKWLDREGFFSAKFVYQNSVFINYDVVFYP